MMNMITCTVTVTTELLGSFSTIIKIKHRDGTTGGTCVMDLDVSEMILNCTELGNVKSNLSGGGSAHVLFTDS